MDCVLAEPFGGAPGAERRYHPRPRPDRWITPPTTRTRTQPLPSHNMLWIASLALVIAPQEIVIKSRPDSLRMRGAESRQQDPRARSTRDLKQEQFEKRLFSLRRSLHLSKSKELALIRKLTDDFDALPQRCLRFARTADQDVAYALMRVLEVFGSRDDADDLKFLLLTRSFGTSTQTCVKTLHMLLPNKADAKRALLDLLTATKDAVRRYAAIELAPLVAPDDSRTLITLTEQGRRDVQLKCLRLLGYVDTDAARERLIRAFEQKATLAEAACRGMITQGEKAIPALQKIVEMPALGRSFGYAVFALTSVEEKVGRPLLTAKMRENLLTELDAPDVFMRSVVSVALCSMAWRSDDTGGAAYKDKVVVGQLVGVVAPRSFVPHLALLQDLTLTQLMRFTGRDFGVRQSAWREWWTAIEKIEYVGSRRRVAMTIENAPNAVLTCVGRETTIRFRGEKVSFLPEIKGCLDYLLSPEEFVAMVSKLEGYGFMGDERLKRGVVDSRQIRLSVGGARAQSSPLLASRIRDRMMGVLDTNADSQSWQLYRDVQKEPDAAAFWRSERRWYAQNEDPKERRTHLKDRILSVLPQLSKARAGRALAHLTSMPDLAALMSESDGLAIVAAIEQDKKWDEQTYRYVSVALLAKNDSVWKGLLRAAEDKLKDGGDRALARIFGILGPERLIHCVSEGSKPVRIAAMKELCRLRDLRATSSLTKALFEDDIDLRRNAVYALGMLRAPSARKVLLELLEEEGDTMDSEVRRTTWIALARIGGGEIVSVLQQAFMSSDPADQRAVIQALGAFDHRAAANQLAEIFALRGVDELGQLALAYLKKKGDLAASPALQRFMDHRNPEVRREFIEALAEFGNPVSVPGLITLLAEDSEKGSARLISQIAIVTGQNLVLRNDRLRYLRSWYSRNRTISQAQWFLDALREPENNVRTSLRSDQLGKLLGTVCVPELTRIMMDCEKGFLQSMACRMLRVTTQKDFGTIGPQTPEERRQEIADRYRFLMDSDRAATHSGK